MVDGSRFVGLDVRARESACAVIDLASGEVVQRRVRGRPERVLEFLERDVARPWRAVYEAGPTGCHRDWLAGLRFADRASELAFADYLHAHDALLARRDRLDGALVELSRSCRQAPLIATLRCLRGIDTLSAVGLASEIEFTAFAKPDKVSAFVGLVPSENSSGERRRQGHITKAGSRHARRLLVEAAWHYRRPPRVAKDLRARQAGQPPAAIETSWRTQQRLHARWQHLEGQRGKRSTTVAVAVARELVAFCWELAHQT